MLAPQPLAGGGGSGGRIPPNYPTIAAEPPQPGRIPMNTPGGAIVPYGTGPLTSGLGAPGTGTAGGGQTDPRLFQELLNKLAGNLGGVAKYGAAAAPGVANIAGGITGGDLGQTLTGAAQVAAGAGVTRAAAPLGAAVTRGATAMLPGPAKIAAPFIGGATQALTGAIASAGLGAGIGKAAEAVGNIPAAQREAGQTPGAIPGTSAGGVGLSNLSGEQKQIADLARLMGVEIPAQQAAALMPYANQMKNADMQRQMQLNQQLGQLTGALNRQQYAFQLAGGAQSQAGENLRTMMTSNPYASSTFRY